MAATLSRRLPRELKSNAGKYGGIFALIVIIIAFGAGFLASIETLMQTNENIPQKYALEDGRFMTSFKVDEQALQEAEEASGTTIYENFSYDMPASFEGKSLGTVRAYQHREVVNIAAYFEGHAPEAADEIALNKNYCDNNGLAVGDVITLSGRDMTICGILTLPDYIALFQNNSDMMLNAVTFCVGEVSPVGFEALEGTETFTYSFVFNNSELTQAQKHDQEEDLAESLEDNSVVLSDLIDASANQGINYAAEDQEGDSLLMFSLLAIVIVIVAFVFAVLVSATITDESAIIGTLLASGYRKREILLHYLTLPALVGILGAIVGNLIGYGYMVDFVEQIYTKTYSYPPLDTVFSMQAFLLTTVVPLVLLIGITTVALLFKLRCTPLQFLRHELTRRRARAGLALPERLSFTARFRIRLIMCNKANYFVLMLGVFFASVLYLFGSGLLPAIQTYADLSVENMPVQHEYVLKAPVELEGSSQQRADYAALVELSKRSDADDIDFEEVADLIDASSLSISEMLRLSDLAQELEDASADTVSGETLSEVLDFIDESTLGASDKALLHHARLIAAVADIDEDAPMINTQENSAAAIEQAEKFAMYSLAAERPTDLEREDVSVYGIQSDSAYYPTINLMGNKVVVGKGFAEKFGALQGATIELYDKYTDKTYTFEVQGTYGNSADTNIYLALDAFNSIFDNEESYFNGYLSNEALEIEPTWLASEINEQTLTGYMSQMVETFSDIVLLFNVFAIVIYLILMYLLTKTIIERGACYISYMKVFGYTDKEVSRLYVRSITLAVVVFLVLLVPVAGYFVQEYCSMVFATYSGHIVVSFPASAYVETFAAGIICYALVALFHLRRIKRVPLSLALKVTE